MFLKACEYAIRAVLYIAEQSLIPQKIGIQSIAVAIESPEVFTAKTLQSSQKQGLYSP